MNSTQNNSGIAVGVMTTMIIGLLMMSILFSSSLVSLSYDLPPGNLSESIVIASETWHGWMVGTGANIPVETISEAIEALHDSTISEEY